MALTVGERQRVKAEADAFAQKLGVSSAADLPLKQAEAVVAHVSRSLTLPPAEVRAALLESASEANDAAEKGLEKLGAAGSYQGATQQTPLVTQQGARGLAVQLAQKLGGASANPVQALQQMKLAFTLDDVRLTRVVITDEASDKAVDGVVSEAKKLVKLLGERDTMADANKDTGQIELEIVRVYEGLASRAASGRGVFLSRADATVALAGGERAPSGDDVRGEPSGKPVGRRVANAVAVGVDPASGEKVVLQPMGRVLHDVSLPQLVSLFGARAAREDAAKKLSTAPAALAALRSLTDAEIDKRGLRVADGPIEFVTLSGVAGDENALALPTRWLKADGDLFSRRLIVDGPFRGIFVDDLVGHIDESALQKSIADSRLNWLSPKAAGLLPVITTMEVERGGESKTMLRLRVPSTPEWTAVRQSLRALAAKLEGVDLVKDSKNTLFVFTPQNVSFVRKVAQSFAISNDAQALVEARVKELLAVEDALGPEAIAKYAAKNIGGFKSAFIDREGKSRPFELSEVQRRSIARVVQDGYRGAITLGMGMGKTLVALSALQLLRTEGEKRPFLVVVPEGLEGGFHAEIFSKLQGDDAKKMADQVEVLSYKAFRKAQKDGTLDGKPFNPERYGAVVYDEAHLITDRRTVAGAAVLSFAHPRTMELSGTPQPQPDRLQTMDAGVQGVDLNAKDARQLRKQARDWRKLLFTEVNGIAVAVKGAFELKRGLKIDPTREMLEWIRTRFIYADSFDDDVELPKRTDVHVALTMTKVLEEKYRDQARPAKVALEGLVSIYRDHGVQVSDDGAPQTWTDKRGKERTQLARQARDPRVHSIKSTLKPTISDLSALTNTDEKVRMAGKKLLELMHEDELRGVPPTRSLLFTDSRAFVLESARVLSEQIPTKLHAACVNDEIRLYRNGKPLDKLGPFELPFSTQAYRKDPTKPAHPETNPEIPPEAWRTFVLNEIIGKHPEVATTTLFGPTYQAGQNLQWANAVVHLDRDTWSDFNMRQREARVHRRGQTRPVTVMFMDYAFAKPKTNLDRTLDEVRKLQAQNDRTLLEGTLVAAQKIKLGEGFADARDARSFDETVEPSVKDLALVAAGADPSPEALGSAGGP